METEWDKKYTFEERTELNFDDTQLKVWIVLRRMDELELKMNELKELLLEHRKHKLVI